MADRRKHLRLKCLTVLKNISGVELLSSPLPMSSIKLSRFWFGVCACVRPDILYSGRYIVMGRLI